MHLNQMILAGNLGGDATAREVETTQGKRTVLNLRVAYTRHFKAGGEQREATDWFDVVYWPSSEAQLAYLRDRLVKGASVLVVGEMRFRSWKDKEGNDRTSAELHASSVQPAPTRTVASREQPEPPTGTATPPETPTAAPRREEPQPDIHEPVW